MPIRKKSGNLLNAHRIWPIDRTLSNATTLSQSGPGSNDNEGVLPILQSSNAGISSSDGLVSYLEHSLGESYPSAKMQSAYSTAPADWAMIYKFLCYIIKTCIALF